MKYGILIFILILLIVAAGCAVQTDGPGTASGPAVKDPASTPTVTVRFEALSETDENAHTLTGEDAAYLIDLLQKCNYDPLAVCKCVPPILVTLENGEKYGFNLSEGYARSWSAAPQGQAALSAEQRNAVQAIFARLTNEDLCSLPKKD